MDANRSKRRNAGKYRGKQGKKDSDTKRVNFDNERESKFLEDEKDYPMNRDKQRMRRTSKSNDVSWYTKSPQLLRSAASIPYSDVVGMPLPQGTLSVPGVMELAWIPYVGGVNDAINIAANEIYSYVVHANSRNQSYDAPDLMMLVIAGAQVFSAISAGLRAYGLMRRYDQMDYYTPDAILRGCGFNPSDLKSNYSHMWFDLNKLIAQSKQIWIPNTMPVIERWYWLNNQVFMDGDSVKSQYYVLTQTQYFKYDETGSTRGGQLKPTPMPSTWNAYVAMVQSLIDALISSQDRGIIFGDILKAYGPEKLYSLGEITSDYTTVPTYDREVLSQIENATVFGVSNNEYGNIAQDPNTNKIFQGVRNTGLADTTKVIPASYQDCAPNQLVLNFHQKEIPTDAQTMVASRLTSAGFMLASKSGGKWYVKPYTAGTEIVTAIFIWYNSWANGIPTITAYQVDANVNAGDSSVFPNYNYEAMMLYTAFDWAPGIHIAVPTDWTLPTDLNGGWTVPAASYKVLDYDLYTHIEITMLKRISDTAVLSEFGVPSNL